MLIHEQEANTFPPGPLAVPSHAPPALEMSRATSKRSLNQRRATGKVAPKASAGRPPKQVGPLQAGLEAQLHAHEELSCRSAVDGESKVME